jgi:hypothetical protein
MEEQIALARVAARELCAPNAESAPKYRGGKNSHTGEAWAYVEPWEGLQVDRAHRASYYGRRRKRLVCGTGPGGGAGGAGGGSTPAASNCFARRHAHQPYAPTTAPIDR